MIVNQEPGHCLDGLTQGSGTERSNLLPMSPAVHPLTGCSFGDVYHSNRLSGVRDVGPTTVSKKPVQRF